MAKGKHASSVARQNRAVAEEAAGARRRAEGLVQEQRTENARLEHELARARAMLADAETRWQAIADMRIETERAEADRVRAHHRALLKRVVVLLADAVPNAKIIESMDDAVLLHRLAPETFPDLTRLARRNLAHASRIEGIHADLGDRSPVLKASSLARRYAAESVDDFTF